METGKKHSADYFFSEVSRLKHYMKM